MSHVQDSDSPPETLSSRELAVLEYCAEGLIDSEIAARLGMSQRKISAVRARAAAKLTARIGTAHPFRIHEVVLARSLDI
jgi:DNA-binding NarL/FixJ family response regulator